MLKDHNEKMSDNIKVVVKVRPLIAREIEDGAHVLWRAKNNTLYQVDSSGRDIPGVCGYTFDKVYDKEAATQDVYDDIAKPIVESATAGINGTIFAYGQTSSGKTYTMMGNEENLGIIPLAVFDIFNTIKNKTNRDFLLRVSYIEIYNESIKDLLDTSKSKIKINETIDGAVKVDASEHVMTTPQEVLDIMRQGELNRQVGATNMNEQSSRSHTIFQITIESREHSEEEAGCTNVSQLNLVDLAGSERAGQTGATGVRFREGTHINRSLSALGHVIMQLSEDPNRFVNYRDSKLTRILQNSLGGNAKTSIICAVTPATVEETISTLQFANRAKAIKNKPEVNAVATNATMLQSLTKKLASLQYELDTKKHLEDDNEKLLQKIKGLQKMILFGITRPSERHKQRAAPRRATIAGHMPSIQEESFAPPPSLGFAERGKSLRGGATTRRASDIPELPEPPVTPPQRRRLPTFPGEVITLDDSDDETIDQPCSPYHKCYETSKTPPCILRDKARKAETNYSDLIELTEREKIFSPKTVELLERIDKNSMDLAMTKEETDKLKADCAQKDDEIASLKQVIRQYENDSKTYKDELVELEMMKSVCFEKDLDNRMLREKIAKYEDEIKINCKEKTDFEQMIAAYKTSVTDLEVCLENVKQKSKQREAELLSLLEDKHPSRLPDKSNVEIKAQSDEVGALDKFLNLSKDFSLVCSDVENSITSICQDNVAVSDEIKNLQSDLNEKNDVIRELNKKLSNSHQSIKMYCDEIEAFTKDRESILNNHKLSIDDLNLKLEKTTADLNVYENFVNELRNGPIGNRSGEEFLKINDGLPQILEELKNIIELTNISSKEHSCTQEFMNDKDNEINKLNNTLHKLKEEYSMTAITLNDEIATLIAQNNGLIKENEQLLSNASLLQNELDELKHHINSLMSPHKQLQFDVEELRKCKDSAISENKELLNELNKAKQIIYEISLKAEQSEVLSSDTENLKCKLNATKCELDRLSETLDTVTSQNVTLNSNVNNMKTQVHTFEQRLLEKSDVILTLETKLANSKQTFEETASQVKSLTSFVENLRQEQDALIKELGHKEILLKNHLENEETLKQDIKSLSTLLSEKRNEVDILNNQSAILRDEIVSLRQDKEFVESLRKDCAKLNICIQEKDNEIAILEATILNLQQDIKHVNEKVLSSETLTDKLKEKIHLLSCLSEKVENMCNNIGVCEVNLIDIYNVNETFNLMENKIKSLRDQNSLITCFEQDTIKTTHDANLVHADSIKLLETTLKHRENELEKLRQECNFKDVEIDRLEKLNNSISENVAKQKDCDKEVLSKIFLQFEYFSKLFENFNSETCNKISKVDGFNRELFRKVNLLTNKIKTENSMITQSEANCPKITRLPSLIELTVKKVNEDILKHYTLNDKPGPECSRKQESTSSHQSLDGAVEPRQTNIELVKEVFILKQKNSKLKSEMNQVKDEVKLLLELSDELHKQISKHRTQLSTLTATTYAENRLLRTKLKALHHHHNRLHAVCRKEVPWLREQLCSLHSLLQNVSKSTCDNDPYEHDLTVTDNIAQIQDVSAIEISMSKLSMPPLGNETLMLGENFTLSPSANSTMISQSDITRTSMRSSYNINVTDIPIPQLNEDVRETNRTDDKSDHEDYDITKTDNNLPHPGCCNIENLEHSISEIILNIELNKQSYNILSYKFNNHSDTCILKKAFKAMCSLLASKDKELQQLITTQSEKTNTEPELLSVLEKELSAKTMQIGKLDQSLETLKACTQDLQSENNRLSDEIMDLLLENDNLKSEIKQIQSEKSQLSECLECIKKSEIISSIQKSKTPEHVLRDCTITYSNFSQQTLDTTLNKNNCSMSSNSGNMQYEHDRQECINFLISKNINLDINEELQNEQPIVNMMKLLYEALFVKHNNELQNLHNNLKQFQEDKATLHAELNVFAETNQSLSEKIKKETENHIALQEKISLLRERVQTLYGITTGDIDMKLLGECLKNYILEPVDSIISAETAIFFARVLTSIQERYEKDLSDSNKKCLELEEVTAQIRQELNIFKNKLNTCSEKCVNLENELATVKEQKERISQISRAVTIDLVRRDENLKQLLTEYSNGLDSSVPAVELTAQVFSDFKNRITSMKNQYYTDVEGLKSQYAVKDERLKTCESELNEKESQLNTVRSENNQLQETLRQYESEYRTLKTMHELLIDEGKMLSEKLEQGERTVNEQKMQMEELKKKFSTLEEDNTRMESVMSNLKEKGAIQHEQLSTIRIEIDEKNQEIVQLKKNIQTHQKSADFQTNMLKRLQREKDDLEAVVKDKSVQIEQLTAKCNSLQSENDDFRSLKCSLKMAEHHSEGDSSHKSSRNSLEHARGETRRRRQSVHDLHRTIVDIDENAAAEPTAHPDAIFGACASTRDMFGPPSSRRQSSDKQNFGGNLPNIDNVCETDDDKATSRRRRRQSVHDMNRASAAHLFLSSKEEINEENQYQIETEPLKKVTADAEAATYGSDYTTEMAKLKSELESVRGELESVRGELESVRGELESVRGEHESLQQRYRELDDECDMCANALREAEQRCVKWGRVKLDLERQLEDTKSLLQTGQGRQSSATTVDASVNTDMDVNMWSGAVVDRMTYDAEREHRRRLEKTFEKARAELKLARQQCTPTRADDDSEELRAKLDSVRAELESVRAESNTFRGELESVRGDLESMRGELESVRGEHVSLQQRYRELDEECEMCAETLRETEQRCVKLARVKRELEAQLAQLSGESASPAAVAARLRRQSFHDMSRDADAPCRTTDRATNTEAAVSGLGVVDVMTFEAERDRRRRAQAALEQLKVKYSDLGKQLRRAQTTHQGAENTVAMFQPNQEMEVVVKLKEEIQQLRSTVEELRVRNDQLSQYAHSISAQSLSLSAAPPPTILVATGSAIVQNQQLCEYMKENHRLKKQNEKLVKLCKKRSKLNGKEDMDVQ